jgi:hypothetical protein
LELPFIAINPSGIFSDCTLPGNGATFLHLVAQPPLKVAQGFRDMASGRNGASFDKEINEAAD